MREVGTLLPSSFVGKVAIDTIQAGKVLGGKVRSERCAQKPKRATGDVIKPESTQLGRARLRDLVAASRRL